MIQTILVLASNVFNQARNVGDEVCGTKSFLIELVELCVYPCLILEARRQSAPEALRHLIAETGSGQIMIGTDYPFPWTSTEVDLVLNTPGLSDAERVAILGGTAARLLGIQPG